MAETNDAEQDPYELLGVPREADYNAVQDAYARKASDYKRELGGDRLALRKAFDDLNRAHSILGYPERRIEYERSLGIARVQAQPLPTGHRSFVRRFIGRRGAPAQPLQQNRGEGERVTGGIQGEKRREAAMPSEPPVAEPEAAMLTEPAVAQPEAAILTEPAVAQPEAAMLTEPAVAQPEAAMLNEPGVAEPEAAMLTEPAAAQPEAAMLNEPAVTEPEAAMLNEPAVAEPEAAMLNEPAVAEPEGALYRQSLERLASEHDPEHAIKSQTEPFGRFSSQFLDVVQHNAWVGIQAIEAGEVVPDENSWLEIQVLERVLENRRQRIAERYRAAALLTTYGVGGLVLISIVGVVLASTALVLAPLVVAAAVLLSGLAVFIAERLRQRSVDRLLDRLLNARVKTRLPRQHAAPTGLLALGIHSSPELGSRRR